MMKQAVSEAKRAALLRRLTASSSPKSKKKGMSDSQFRRAMDNLNVSSRMPGMPPKPRTVKHNKFTFNNQRVDTRGVVDLSPRHGSRKVIDERNLYKRLGKAGR